MIHRRREYGPFDYEWSKDLGGMELLYRGQKFGEYCSENEIFADLTEFKLPRRVAEVASVVLGCIVFSILRGHSDEQRAAFLRERLRLEGLERFLDDSSDE